MPDFPAVNIAITTVRDIAHAKLNQLASAQQPIRECYLLQEEFFCGIRYESGPFEFTWNLKEDFATIQRSGLLIETVDLVPRREQRRAA